MFDNYIENKEIRFTLNGKEVSINTNPLKRLLDVLRKDFNITGTKEGCGEGECGACTVLMNDRSVLSCLIPIGSVEGKIIETIESFSEGKNGIYNTILEEYNNEGACQCGFCIPGFIVETADYIKNKNKASYTNNNLVNSDEYIKRALSGNLCRCTGYETIMNAVKKINEKDNK